jgi:hypothetical protein
VNGTSSGLVAPRAAKKPPENWSSPNTYVPAPPETMCAMSDDQELPVDPDHDALPAELAEADRPLRISGIDRATGERFEGPVAKDHVAAGFADRRRHRDEGEERPA